MGTKSASVEWFQFPGLDCVGHLDDEAKNVPFQLEKNLRRTFPGDTLLKIQHFISVKMSEEFFLRAK